MLSDNCCTDKRPALDGLGLTHFVRCPLCPAEDTRRLLESSGSVVITRGFSSLQFSLSVVLSLMALRGRPDRGRCRLTEDLMDSPKV